MPKKNCEERLDGHKELRKTRQKHKEQLQLIQIDILKYRSGYESLMQQWREELQGAGQNPSEMDEFNRANRRSGLNSFNRGSSFDSQNGFRERSFGRGLDNTMAMSDATHSIGQPSFQGTSALRSSSQGYLGSSNLRGRSFGQQQYSGNFASPGPAVAPQQSSYASRYLQSDFQTKTREPLLTLPFN